MADNQSPYWCKYGQPWKRIILCSADCTLTGHNQEYSTQDGTKSITTENWCRDHCKLVQTAQIKAPEEQ